MKDPVLRDIEEYATKKLNQAFGFCGQASGDDIAMLNSTGDDGRDIKITIKVED